MNAAASEHDLDREFFAAIREAKLDPAHLLLGVLELAGQVFERDRTKLVGTIIQRMHWHRDREELAKELVADFAVVLLRQVRLEVNGAEGGHQLQRCESFYHWACGRLGTLDPKKQPGWLLNKARQLRRDSRRLTYRDEGLSQNVPGFTS